MENQTKKPTVREVHMGSKRPVNIDGIDFLKVILGQVEDELLTMEACQHRALKEGDPAKIVTYTSAIAQLKMQAVVAATQAEVQAAVIFNRLQGGKAPASNRAEAPVSANTPPNDTDAPSGDEKGTQGESEGESANDKVVKLIKNAIAPGSEDISSVIDEIAKKSKSPRPEEKPEE